MVKVQKKGDSFFPGHLLLKFRALLAVHVQDVLLEISAQNDPRNKIDTGHQLWGSVCELGSPIDLTRKDEMVEPLAAQWPTDEEIASNL